MSDFGGKLRLARERRGISLRQVAASTKISVATLEALERNDISKLPGGIFSRGFVRSYAIEVGLEPDETVREFLDRFPGEPAPASHVPVAIPEEESQFESQQRMAGVMLKLVLVSLPIIAVILYFTFRSRPADVVGPPPTTAGQAASVESAPSAAAPSAAAPPSQTPGEAPAASLPAAPVAGSMRIEMHPTGECWVRLTVDGERIMERVMQPGEREARDVKDTAIVEVGDAAAFAFSINGRPGRSLGGPGERKTARITRATMGDFLR